MEQRIPTLVQYINEQESMMNEAKQTTDGVNADFWAKPENKTKTLYWARRGMGNYWEAVSQTYGDYTSPENSDRCKIEDSEISKSDAIKSAKEMAEESDCVYVGVDER